MKKYFTPILVTVLALFGVITFNQTAGAADMSRFNAGNIMSDYVMSNKNSMTEAQIQQFLTNKNPCNDTNTAKAAQYPNMTYNIKDGKFVCLSKEVFNGETAAKIIWQAAQDYNINPQVLIVLLQKEQGLVTDTWPNHNVQYRSATGYGCPDYADCNSKYYGFKNQVRNAANFFRAHLDNRSGWYKPHVPGVSQVRYSPVASCGSSSVNIENRATSGLYSYTPYQPNRAALNTSYGGGDGCSAYGNRNFWAYFNDWFGPTQGMVYGNIDYFSVFDPEFYLNSNLDLKEIFNNNPSAAFDHFINYGAKEGRVAHPKFNVNTYMNRYVDLRTVYGDDFVQYFLHYILFGKREGRSGEGTNTLTPVTIAYGVDYSPIYDYHLYKKVNSDIKLNDVAALNHFIDYGMNEGRIASQDFNVSSYKNRYPDLRKAFGNDNKQYYLHYLHYGKKEGRVGTGNVINGTVIANNTNYSSIYSFSYYISMYNDMKNTFKLNDVAALNHFIDYGMNEGRIASQDFNVSSYKNRYPDLRKAFGNDNKQYYLHYLHYGKKEGRVGI